MDSNHVLNNMLDYDTYIENVLSEVRTEDGQHPPPMYNFLRGFHSILRMQINNTIDEARVMNNAQTLSTHDFHSKIHNIITTKKKECSICLDDIEENTICSVLPCLHSFHENCIKKWLTMNKSTCPECRNSI